MLSVVRLFQDHALRPERQHGAMLVRVLAGEWDGLGRRIGRSPATRIIGFRPDIRMVQLPVLGTDFVRDYGKMQRRERMGTRKHHQERERK